ncbi:MAG: phage/plasmid primase, P4 family [Bryobacteraceae bacterium]|nr:phage/plasmid primase, P4 family [Bryobacteraceae bacterium]
MSTNILPACPDNANAGPDDFAFLIITVDGETRSIDPHLLTDKADVAAIIEWCGGAVEPVVLTVRAFPSWPSQCRAGLYSFANQLVSYSVQLDGQPGSYPDLFAALVAAIAPPENLEAHQSTLELAIEAAREFFHGVAQTSAATAIRDRLRELGVTGARVPTLVKEISGGGGPYPGITLDNPTLTATAYIHYVGGDAQIEDYEDLLAETPHLRYFSNEFWRWDGHRWVTLPEALLKAQVVAYLFAQAPHSKHTDRYVRDVITNLKGQSILDCWGTSPPFRVTSQKPLVVESAHILALQNGVLGLNSDADQLPTLVAHSPTLFNTSVIPYGYDPEAQCSLFIETLNMILPLVNDSDHRVDVLQEFMGYSLLIDCRFQKLLIMFGNGANGKSTIMNTWRAMLGPDNVSHVALDHFGAEYHLAQLVGKLANLSSDMAHVDIAAEGILKQLVSGEPLQVNAKYKDPFPMRSTAKLIFATNELPTVSDRSDGLWRRMITMPFYVRFVHRSTELYCEPHGTASCLEQPADPDLDAKLREELPGILNWALVGLRRLLRQGGFTTCAVCAASLTEHRLQSDPFRLFVDECLVFQEGGHADSVQAYDLYHAFCKRNGAKPLGKAKFGKRMHSLRGVTRERYSRGSRGYYYERVSLVNEALIRYLSQAPAFGA